MLSNIKDPASWRKISIALAVICLLLVIVGAVSISSMQSYKQTVQTYDQEQNATIALQTSRMIEDKMEDLEEEVSMMTIGNLIPIYQGQDCLNNIKKYFKLFVGQMSNLARVGPDGVFRCSMNPALEGQSIKTMAPFLVDLFENPKHPAAMSRGVPVPGQDTMAIAVHVPVFTSEGAFNGTIGGAVYLNQFTDKIFKNINIGTHRFVVVLDDDGTILYHPDAQYVGVNVDSPKFAALDPDNSPTYKGILHNSSANDSGFVNYVIEGKRGLAAYETAHVFEGRRWIILVPVMPR